MRVEVVIPTWNSERMLEKCLEAIRRYLSPERIIIVDRASKDRTQEIARAYDCTVLIDVRSLGSARMKGIEEARSDWIAFIDDDIVIDETFKDLFKFVDDRTGAVQGIAIPPDGEARKKALSEIEQRFRAAPHGFIDLGMRDRGYTNVTITRKDLLTDLDISDMNAYEDWTISRHVLKKGFRWKVVPIFADHLHIEKRTLYKSAWNTGGLFNMTLTGRLPLPELMYHYGRRLLGEYKAMLAAAGTEDGRSRVTSFVGCVVGPVFPLLRMKRKAAGSKSS